MIGFGSWYVVHGLSYLCWESIGLIRLCKLIEMSTVHGSRFTSPAPQSCNQTIHASIQQHQDLRLYSGVVSGSLAPSVNWQQWVMHRLGLRDQDMAEPSKDYSLRSWLLRKRTWTSSKCHQVLRYVSSSLQALRNSTVLDVSYLSFLLAVLENNFWPGICPTSARHWPSGCLPVPVYDLALVLACFLLLFSSVAAARRQTGAHLRSNLLRIRTITDVFVTLWYLICSLWSIYRKISTSVASRAAADVVLSTSAAIHVVCNLSHLKHILPSNVYMYGKRTSETFTHSESATGVVRSRKYSVASRMLLRTLCCSGAWHVQIDARLACILDIWAQILC